MAYSIKLIRAAFGSVAIIGSAVLGVSVMTDTFAASKTIYKTNFNKQQCKIVTSNGSTKGLAVVGSTQNACYCISKNGRRILRPPTAAAAAEVCSTLTPQKQITTAPDTTTTTTTETVTRGDNGWGNGPDGTNNGSFQGGGIAQGGPGTTCCSGQTTTDTKDGGPNVR